MHALPRPQSLLIRYGGAFLFTMLLAFALHATTGLGGAGMDRVFNVWVYDALIVGAAGSCLLRAAMIERERLAWGLLGVGLAAWTGGEIYYSAVLAGAETVPIPSLADPGYLLFYPLAYAALIVLLRNRIGSFPVARWLDGLVVGTAIAALAAAVALGPIVDASTSGDTAAVVTNLAYPIADLALLTLVFTASAFTGWRPGRTWLMLGSGLVVLAVSDGVYLLQSAQGTYAEGGILDVAWPLGMLLLASAAWQEPARRQVVRSRGLRVALVPATAAVIAIGIQFSDRSSSVPTIAAWLSLLTLLAVVVRMMVSFRENQANLESSVRESLTDSLTGLANRRHLMDDLEQAAAHPPDHHNVCLLALFDLDGFKAYNDAYGHPTGDALLARLGGRLADFAGERATAYRLGGDEFCLLAECTAAEVDGFVAGASAALSERGDGFLVTSSQGSVLLPSEASTSEAALQLADRRYEVFRAAELHDTGKVAIPDAILNKPGPLEDQEWEFMREHTLIGERIIASAPALVPVARLVRSTQERWDGSGYPDGLAGEQIPLGSRVISVCNAYAAMVSDRAYSIAMRPTRALEELRRGAGSQFDATVVDAFCSLSDEDATFLVLDERPDRGPALSANPDKENLTST